MKRKKAVRASEDLLYEELARNTFIVVIKAWPHSIPYTVFVMEPTLCPRRTCYIFLPEQIPQVATFIGSSQEDLKHQLAVSVPCVSFGMHRHYSLGHSGYHVLSKVIVTIPGICFEPSRPVVVYRNTHWQQLVADTVYFLRKVSTKQQLIAASNCPRVLSEDSLKQQPCQTHGTGKATQCQDPIPSQARECQGS